MADIFLSYAREDTDLALAVLQGLERDGWSVWFDRNTPAASQWGKVLELELERARCVVMLWSNYATKSEWVPREGKVGMERAALVPVLIQTSNVPEMFGSIQFADLTSWDGDPTAPRFMEFIETVRQRMLPSCIIRFQSILQPCHDDLELMYDAFLRVAGRIVEVGPGSFKDPSTSDEKRRLARAIASLQVSIDWAPVLSKWIRTDSDREIWFEYTARIERRMPLIWLNLLHYSGPFFSSASSPHTYANYLRFSSLMFAHKMFHGARLEGRHVDIPSLLKDEQLSYPRWEGAISAVFDREDETALAYVTHIDDLALPREKVIYSPRRRAQRSYGRTLRKFGYADPSWLERYMIPQHELQLALGGSTDQTIYGGDARIRKITDLDGNDLPPLYE